ncbi:NAD(P)-dependent oxidoreductase [Pelistega suis]|uniref:D-2-hydroxyacid dehydrogenase family protein n=1 Tax=Pelistega suis TaxID=1631957 RepID=A0A849P306_9BURK|nr:NAD(P)-dependent oxidoreductase [Pelistega suis]NOL52029.1 D-2-hydroxyacid dehydrogenase family protein [Pelistega suis]
MIKVTVLDDWESLFHQSLLGNHALAAFDITVYKESLRGNDLLNALKDTEILVLFRERTPIDKTVLTACTSLKRIICTGAQTRNLDSDAARELNIEVSYAKGGNSKESTCEITWLLLIAAFKRLSKLALHPEHRRWRVDDIAIPRKLKGKTLGLIGLGHIGQKVATVAQAFGMRVMAWSPHLTVERAAPYSVQCVDKQELLSSADVISLHMVLSESTKHLLSEEDFAVMKPAVCIVNTSRAELVEQSRLLAFLKENPQAIYVTDVFEQEPLSATHPFYDIDNVVMTGHWGFICDEVYEGFAREVTEQLLAYQH